MTETISIETKRVTGFVLPLGNGAVGKSSLTSAMDFKSDNPVVGKKSINMEFGYVLDRLIVANQPYQIMQQYLVPPGQKASEGISGGRNFEEIISTYRFLLGQIDVILFSYKLVEVNTFNDLEYWVQQALTLSNPFTQYIMVGTHLDMDHSREVTPRMIANGSEFIRSLIKDKYPDWRGKVPSLEVSVINNENLTLLRNTISVGILRAKRLLD